MAILDVAAFTDAMKVKYGTKLEKYWYEEACPAAKLIKKVGGFGGSTHNFAAAISGSSGGVVFATAQTNASVPVFEQRALTPTKEYQIGKVDNMTMYLSKGAGAFEQAVQAQMDSCMQGFANATSHQIWNNGGGARGRIATGGITTTTITLSERADIVNFWKNLTLELSDDDGLGGGGVRAGTPMVVDSVNSDAGTVTMTANVTTSIAGAVADDYIFREDDYNATLKGILAWVPVTAPAPADSFFGVDRSDHVNRMAGSRVVAAGLMEDAIYDACGELDLLGGSADTLFMGPLRYAELVKSIDSRAFTKIGKGGDAGNLGVTALSVASPSGTINVVSDRNCPNAYGLLTKLSNWELLYAGPGCPHFEEAQGRMNVEPSSDGLEFRLKSYWQGRCKVPRDNVLITWA